jgi:predicted RNA binding protein YcfA (HicA-like mRNA interferase family)
MPVLSGREIVKRLRHFGFEVDRQVGSHIILRRQIPPAMTLSVPDHKSVKKRHLSFYSSPSKYTT